MRKTKAVTKKKTVAMEKTETVVRQAVVNIGLVGHVDHGKCIALDEPILLNNELCTGSNLISEKCTKTMPQKISQNEEIFDVPNLRVFSLDQNFEMISVPAKVFLQKYLGEMIEVITNDGKRVKVSPDHPLLLHNGQGIFWAKAKELKKGCYIGAVKNTPENNVLKDPFPEWLEKLENSCWVVSRERAKYLEEKTKSFTEFGDLSVSELNEIRILNKMSCNRLDKASGNFLGYFSSCLRRGRIQEKQKTRIIGAFKSRKSQLPDRIIINTKNKSHSFAEIANTSFGEEDMLSFIAFIIAEGHVGENRIKIAQSENILLKKFLNTCLNQFEVKPVKYSTVDYSIHNRALVEFLRTRYGLALGASRKAGIPAWVYSLPNHKLKIFLRTFFSAEGNANEKSGQIALIQANKKTICLLGYCLKKFGIRHSIHPIKKHATNSPEKKKRIYWQILISGIQNLKKFMDIGFELKEKQIKLEKMCSKRMEGKETNRIVPLNFQLLSRLVDLLGLKKNNFTRGTTTLKQREWYFAYRYCRYKNAVSEKKLGLIILSLRNHLQEMEECAASASILQTMAEWGVTQKNICESTGISPKKLWKAIHAIDEKEECMVENTIRQSVQIILHSKAEEARKVLEKIEAQSPKNVEWCKIKALNRVQYQGQIIDLQVPGYHNFICGMGGFISHNTSLAQALTGKWTDTHSEELKRGISIKLGYADAVFYSCNHGNKIHYTTKDKCPETGKKTKVSRIVSFVDAPGHETLMTTMLSGAALMHGAVLVIAANEPCPQPQTEEHLMALKISGIKHIIVAQNKIDLVNKEQAMKNVTEIKELLGKYGYEGTPIIPIAANFGSNIDLLIEAIETTIPTPRFDENKPLKMYCSRSFDINKPGTIPKELRGGVFGGSIIEGIVRVNDWIEISPGVDGKKLETMVASLSTEKGRINEARPGGLIAVGTLLDPSLTQSDRMRGQVIGAIDSLPQAKNRITLETSYIERLIGIQSKMIKSNETLVLTVGTMTTVGNAVIKAKNQVEVNLKGHVVIRAGQKVAISKKDGNRWRLIAYGTCK